MALIPYFLSKSSEVMLTILVNEKDKYTETVKRVYCPVSEVDSSEDICELLGYIEGIKVHEKDLTGESFDVTHYIEYSTPAVSLDVTPLKVNRLFLVQGCTSEVPTLASTAYFRTSSFMSASLQGVRLAGKNLIHQFHPMVGRYIPDTFRVERTRSGFEVSL